MDNNNLLSVSQYAKKTGITPQAIYKQIKKGALKVKVVNGKKFIIANDIESESKPRESQEYNELVEMLKRELENKQALIEQQAQQINNILLLNANLQRQLDSTKQLEYKPKLKDKLKGLFK